MIRPGPFHHILCPVDFSDHSRQALRYAALLASRTQARLSVVFVEDPLLAVAAQDTTVPSRTKTALRQFVQRVAAPYEISNRAIGLHIVAGRPFREIERIAARDRCDLIVLGSHGISGVQKLMLGSTTDRLLTSSRVPILAVPPSGRMAAKGPGRYWPRPLVIAPVDLHSHSRSDVVEAAAIAEALGSPLEVVHVAPSRDKAKSAGARAKMEKLRASVTSPALVETRTLVGNLSEQVAACAAEAKAGLVILTRRRGPGLFGARLGSISYAVLCEGNTPVLALPGTRVWRLTKSR